MHFQQGMPPKLLDFFRRFGDTIGGFSVAQKTLAVLGIAVVLIGGIGLSAWLSKPTYAPLFTGLSASDASAITAQLDTDKVPYQLEDGGASILVPKDNVYKERLAAASNNLPSSDTGGYSLLDKMGVTTSEFQQNVTYKRAMEGELADTIKAIKGVTNASVKLALPQPTVFTDEKEDPTASVFVDTTTGVTLTSDQVQSIVHLTSAAVTGMKTTDVSVIDADGNVLSSIGGGLAGDGSAQAQKYSTATKSDVQSMLDKLVGSGNSTVVVHAAMSNATSDRTTTTYETPKGNPAKSETNQKESYSGSGGQNAAGVLGADTNDASEATTNTTGNGDGSYTSESSTKDNALNKTEQHDNVPAGELLKQTVSVAVDRNAANGMTENQLETLVTNAAGVDTTRGDSVAVQFVAFSDANKKAAQDALGGAKAKTDNQLWLILGAAGGIALLGIIIAIVGIIRRRRRPEAEAPAEPVTASPEDLFPTEVLPTAEAATEQRRREVNALAEANPEQAADALRALIDGNK